MLKYGFKRALAVLLLSGVFIICSTSALAAEIWSEPTYTDQWSNPDVTEKWSEEADDSKPSTTTKSESDHSSSSTDEPVVPLYIKLQIGNQKAFIQNNEQTLEVAPFKVNGRTMVPFRFLGEAVDATVDWNNKEQKVTLSLNNKTIILVIGQSTALVNGKKIELDVPSIKKNGRTFVPLRFIIENLDLHVNYIAASETIEIADQPFVDQEAAPADKPGTPSEKQADTAVSDKGTKEAADDIKKLYGTWHIWTSGSATNLYDKETGEYATHDYTKGAEQGTIVIKADGTYTMKYDIWGETKGKWRLSSPSEINGEQVAAIVLRDGLTDTDWAIAPSGNGKIRLLYSTEWADGSVIWMFDSELYKK